MVGANSNAPFVRLLTSSRLLNPSFSMAIWALRTLVGARMAAGHTGSATAVSTTDWVATTWETACSLTSSAKWQADV